MNPATGPVQRKIALVTAAAASALDDDLPPLQAALAPMSAVRAHAVNWDDPTIDWSQFAVAVLRSTWDYTQRLDEFLDWAARVAAQTTLLNPLAVVRWNTDKHYLRDLAGAGIATVPSAFVEPGTDAAQALDAFLSSHDAAEIVVKPTIGAGSRDAQRHARDGRDGAIAHVRRLLAADRSVLLQPYLGRVDEHGETALVFIEGRYSHAIRKGPLLRRGEGPTPALFAAEEIRAREPRPAERDLAERVLAAMPFDEPLLYARVDLIDDDAGAPGVLELELTEPSLFFAQSEGAAQRFAAALAARALAGR